MIAQFAKHATPRAIRMFNELTGHGKAPEEPFVCG